MGTQVHFPTGVKSHMTLKMVAWPLLPSDHSDGHLLSQSRSVCTGVPVVPSPFSNAESTVLGQCPGHVWC